MKTLHYIYITAALALSITAMAFATVPASAASVTILIKKTDGVRTETTVTPGPKLPDTFIPGTPGTSKDYSNVVSDHCMNSVMFVTPGDPPGTKYPAINVDENCNPFPLATPIIGGTPAVTIDNGYGPDTTTTVNVPTCTRKYKTISTSYPYVSTSETTSDGAC